MPVFSQSARCRFCRVSPPRRPTCIFSWPRAGGTSLLNRTPASRGIRRLQQSAFLLSSCSSRRPSAVVVMPSGFRQHKNGSNYRPQGVGPDRVSFTKTTGRDLYPVERKRRRLAQRRISRSKSSKRYPAPERCQLPHVFQCGVVFCISTIQCISRSSPPRRRPVFLQASIDDVQEFRIRT